MAFHVLALHGFKILKNPYDTHVKIVAFVFGKK
jgi:hypothetical protein